jgi:hypothetical protein
MHILLVGPRGAGVTSFGEALSAHTGWVFHDDLDGARRASAPIEPGVIAAELARDAVFRREHGNKPRIIASWHLVHLARAGIHTPALALGSLRALRRALDSQPLIVIPVTASEDTRRARLQRDRLDGNEHRIVRAALDLAEGCDATLLPPADTTDIHAEEFVLQIADKLLAFTDDPHPHTLRHARHEA